MVERCVLLLLEPEEEAEIPDLREAIADARSALANTTS